MKNCINKLKIFIKHFSDIGNIVLYLYTIVLPIISSSQEEKVSAYVLTYSFAFIIVVLMGAFISGQDKVMKILIYYKKKLYFLDNLNVYLSFSNTIFVPLITIIGIVVPDKSIVLISIIGLVWFLIATIISIKK